MSYLNRNLTFKYMDTRYDERATRVNRDFQDLHVLEDAGLIVAASPACILS